MEYGYKELTIRQPSNTGWISQKHVIHFWPRGNYMLMGFYNVDGSFTLSLHMPFEGDPSFASINTRQELLDFFATNFPDVTDQIGHLTNTYFTNPVNSMITIRCNPWSYRSRVALIGDAAHAIVPYYGQGANTGFEDCAVLDSCIEQFDGNWQQIFREYERRRMPNMEAIANLALQNFVELRARVTDPQFLLRKEVESRIQQRYPDKFATLYSMIAFSSIPFVDALQIDQGQRILVDRIMATSGIEQLTSGELDQLIEAVMQESMSLASV
jgi:kynurenine 3-monooxygenase